MRHTIISPTNPRVKALARLRRRRDRAATGTFPIEGMRVVARALAAGWPLESACLAPGLASDDARELADALEATGIEVVELGDEAFRRVAYREHPDGLLAIGRTVPLDLRTISPPPDALVLVLEGIEKPGNLGGMLRTADAAGVDAVIIADATADPWNPNVVRASQGALFTVALAAASAPTVAAWLGRAGVAVVPADPERGGAAPWEFDLTGSVALVVGSEHAGLSTTWRRHGAVAIPMRGSADSLNASVAAAVLLFEAVRQRS